MGASGRFTTADVSNFSPEHRQELSRLPAPHLPVVINGLLEEQWLVSGGCKVSSACRWGSDAVFQSH